MSRKGYLLLFLSLILVNVAFASKQSELEKITSKIANLKKYLTQRHIKKQSLSNELEIIEKKIATINLQVHQLDQKIDLQKRALKSLQKKQQQYQQKLKKQQQALKKQLRAAYQMGQHSYLQLFLSQQQPSESSRILTYYQAINQARVNIIKDFLDNLQQINTNQARINEELKVLQQLKKKRVKVEQQLLQQQQQRKHLVSQLVRQIKTGKQRIARLQADKKQLQTIVNNLNTKRAYEKFSGVPFARLQHRLPWPVKGHITRDYGQLYDGRLRSNGVFIRAALNSPVRAIASGKVIFANWLRGYGNLLIVSHNDGYMTLYAHNNALFKQIGDTVVPGEEIALVGNSGGLSDAGLYFEIRYKGKTRDPARWCH